jgi:hypothetical protein
MQILPFREEYECSRMKDLRAAAQPRKPHRSLRLALLRRR